MSVDHRAAGTGPAGQAIAGPLLTIIVKSTSFYFLSGIIDSFPHEAADLVASAECAH